MKVSDLLYSAFRILGVLGAAGRSPGQAESTDAFNRLNTMVEAWQLEHLMVYETLRQIFALTGSKQAYTVGPGGDFDMPSRPGRIYPIGFIDAQGNEISLAQYNSRQWGEVQLKGTVSTQPQAYYYQPSMPTGILNFWPVPSGGGEVALYTWHTIDQFTSEDQDVMLPAGYTRAIEYNLAVEIAPIFPRAKLSQTAADIAIDSKAWVKSYNSSQIDIEMISGYGCGCGAYNIYTDC